MNAKQNQENGLESFIQEQTARNFRAARLTWTVGLLFVLFLATYLGGVIYLVHGILEPHTTARMIVRNVEADLPAFMQELEVSLRGEAAPLAADAGKAILDAMPQARIAAQAQIDRAYTDILPALRDDARGAIHDYVVAHEAQIREVVAAHKEKEFAQSFVANLTHDVARDLGKQLATETHGASLDYIRMASLDALKDINAQIAALVTKKAEEMTRGERLQRRLIVSLAQGLDELSCARSREKAALIAVPAKPAAKAAARK